jgi:hypothetical protein
MHWSSVFQWRRCQCFQYFSDQWHWTYQCALSVSVGDKSVGFFSVVTDTAHPYGYYIYEKVHQWKTLKQYVNFRRKKINETIFSFLVIQEIDNKYKIIEVTHVEGPNSLVLFLE